MILPVYVSHIDDPSRERLVYALLDTQSDATFILADTCRSLGLSGVEVKLSLSTLHAENKIVNTQKMKGLVVRGFHSVSRIQLPTAYSREIMPTNRSHIPTPKVVESWPQLHPVAKHLIPLQDCEIGLLIGYNCPRALTPREVVAPMVDGPYGQKTNRGWGVVGIVDPCCSEIDPVGMSHMILAREVPSDLSDGNFRSGSVLFYHRTLVREVVTDDVLRLLECDFRDSTGRDNGQSLSQQDRQFLKLLKDGIVFKDGHYEMP